MTDSEKQQEKVTWRIEVIRLVSQGWSNWSFEEYDDETAARSFFENLCARPYLHGVRLIQAVAVIHEEIVETRTPEAK